MLLNKTILPNKVVLTERDAKILIQLLLEVFISNFLVLCVTLRCLQLERNPGQLGAVAWHRHAWRGGLYTSAR